MLFNHTVLNMISTYFACNKIKQMYFFLFYWECFYLKETYIFISYSIISICLAFHEIIDGRSR